MGEVRPWSVRVVGELAVLKANGVERFEVAWAAALRAHPPRQMDMGESRLTLFAVDGEDEPSLLEFLEVRCRREWLGLESRDFRRGLMSFAAEASAGRGAA